MKVILMLIDTYSTFLDNVGSTFEELIYELTLDNEARQEFIKETYTLEDISHMKACIKFDKEWEKIEDEMELDSDTLPDNFWNE